MPLKKKKKLTSETKYFFIITSALTKPGHCALSRRAKCLCLHLYTLLSRLWPQQLLFLFFLSMMKQKGVSRGFIIATRSVNCC